MRSTKTAMHNISQTESHAVFMHMVAAFARNELLPCVECGAPSVRLVYIFTTQGGFFWGGSVCQDHYDLSWQ